MTYICYYNNMKNSETIELLTETFGHLKTIANDLQIIVLRLKRNNDRKVLTDLVVNVTEELMIVSQTLTDLGQKL